MGLCKPCCVKAMAAAEDKVSRTHQVDVCGPHFSRHRRRMIVFWFVNCASSSFARKSCWTVIRAIGTSVQIVASWAALRRWRAAMVLCESASIAPSKMVVRMTTKTTMTQNETTNQNNKLVFNVIATSVSKNSRQLAHAINERLGVLVDHTDDSDSSAARCVADDDSALDDVDALRF